MLLSNLIITHFVFPAVYTILMVPLYVSIIYGSLETTRFTFLVLHPVYVLTIVLILVVPTSSKLPESFWFNVILGYVAIALSYILVRNIVTAENRKEVLVLRQTKENHMLMEAVLFDGLTGVYNHTGLCQLLEKYIQHYKDGEELFFAIIDLDHFKRINDEYGHEVGNVVLERMGELLRSMQGKDMDVARYGVEEFSICFRGMDMDEAYAALKSLHDLFCATRFEQIGRPVTFSAGLVRYDKKQTVSEFIDAADKALYNAKRSGRNRIVLGNSIKQAG